MRTCLTSLVRFLSLISLLVFFGMGSRTVWAGPNVWTSLGPDGGQVSTLAIDPQQPNTLYAATWNTGIFKSTDAGASWRKANSGLPVGSGHLALVIDPQNPSTLYAGGLGAVYKSTDGGSNWSSSALSPFAVYSLAVDPKNSSTLYVGLYHGAFKTTDGGTTWTTISSTLPPDAAFTGLMIDPQNSATLYAVTSWGVFKSADAGDSWRAINSGLPGYPPLSLAIDPQNPGTLYLSETYSVNRIAQGGLFKSIDGGASWVNSGMPGGYFLAFDPQNPNTLYSAALGGVFKSTDGGASWEAINSGLTAGIFRLALDPQNGGTVYALGNQNSGVFKTTDEGMSWRKVNSGLRLTSIYTLAIDPQNSGTLFASSEVELLKTTDTGKSWISVNSGLPNFFPVSSVAIDPHDSRTIYAGTVDYVVEKPPNPSYPGITYPPMPHAKAFKSTDGGANWSSVLDFGAYGPVSFAFDPQNPDTVYAAGAGSLFKSVDAGASWVALYSWPSFSIESLAIDPRNPSTLYVAGWAGIFKSTDGGTNWEPADSGMTYIHPAYNQTYRYDIWRLAIDPQAPGTLYASAYPTSDDGAGQIFKSTDGGASWSALVSRQRPDCYYFGDLAISARNPSTVYVGTGCGVFKSTDGGTSWTAVNSGLTTLNVLSLAIDPQNANTVYAGTYGGSVFTITFDPDLVVTDLQFDRTGVKAGGSFSTTISGLNLTSQTFFDVRLTSPGSSASDVALNWQRGAAATHGVPVGIAAGIWTIDGVRAHQIEADHTGSFLPVSATITVSP